MEAMFERDFAHAEPIDLGELKKNLFWWRLGVKLSCLTGLVS